MTIPQSDLQLPAPTSLIELFVLDTTPITPGGDIIRFHAGINGLGNNIVWQGNTYTRYPIEAGGFERSGQGTLPRPTIKVANITTNQLGGIISALAYQYQDLLGAKVYRKRTFLKYLDAVNFTGGTNPTADPTAAFPDEIWNIDRKSAEGPVFVEFELAAAFDVAGVLLPRRQCIQNLCTWRYKSTECGYAGGPVADHNDLPTTDASKDSCGKRLSSCKLRFGENNELPYGGFPGVGLYK